MNARIEYALTSEFGPSSEPIDLKQFSQDANSLFRVPPAVPGLDVDEDAIAEECSVNDVTTSLEDVWKNPVLSAYLYKNHDNTTAFLHGIKSSKLAKTRKKNPIAEPYNELKDVKELQEKLDAIPLSSWKLLPEAATFTRPPRNPDFNTLTQIKASDTDMDMSSTGNEPQILVTFSIHYKMIWRQTILNKSSQHVILASQTLGDLFEVIPCVSNELPDEVTYDSELTGYEEPDGMSGSSGCVICINDLAYGDGMSEEDYADKFIQHLKVTKSSCQIEKAKTTMHDTPLSSLALQINKPYWLLHQGSCEHFIVVDEIRLKHATDPASGYPLTIHQTPASLDFCQACTKTPASWSIVGDVRLEASPCLLCAPCWRSMGESEEDSVVAVPLPKYTHSL